MGYALQLKAMHEQMMTQREEAGASRDAMRILASQGYDAASAALSPVQQDGGNGAIGPAQVHEAARSGLAGGGGALPHLAAIQASFGRHDVSGIQAHTGGKAAAACDDMGAHAYATGNSVAFAGQPSLHTAAHEAAHIVQQRAGVSLAGGVGRSGDAYERHADAVADAVVAGRSAEGLLDRYAGGAAGGGAVQQRAVQQRGKKDKDPKQDDVEPQNMTMEEKLRYLQDRERVEVEESGPHERISKAGVVWENIKETVGDSKLGKVVSRGLEGTTKMLPGEDTALWSKTATKGSGLGSNRKVGWKQRAKVWAARAGMAIGFIVAPTVTLLSTFGITTAIKNYKHKKQKRKNQVPQMVNENNAPVENTQALAANRIREAFSRGAVKGACAEMNLDVNDVTEMVLSRLGLGGGQPSWNEEQLEAYVNLESALREKFPVLQSAFTNRNIGTMQRPQREVEESEEQVEENDPMQKQNDTNQN
ncbi:MAG: DUF4157 domain-containing protein [Deltaproteobacteria bacterium]|nr:DUF4157 domain-containing protein [Deltaproteobacteria bacterium]